MSPGDNPTPVSGNTAAAVPPPCGILAVDKPAGISSAGVTNRLKRLIPRGVKIGHAGTLDPFATGLLLVLIGKATRSCESLMNLGKRYSATIRFGAETPTLDPESPEEIDPAPNIPDLPAVQAACRAMVGIISQTPPAFSAMKIAGRRAYALARAGEAVHLPPRPVRIDSIELVSYRWPLACIDVCCGRGTYVRCIARDLAISVGTRGYLTTLRRTQIGPFSLAQAVSMQSLLDGGIGPHLQPIPATSVSPT